MTGMQVGYARVSTEEHLRGKLSKLSVRQEAHLIELLDSGRHSTAEVAELFGVARSTVYRAQQRALAKAKATISATRTGSAPTPADLDRRPRHAMAR